jgi:hypothetical protein
MRGRGLLAAAAPAAAACVLLCGGTSAAHATQRQGPHPSTTTTTTCRFVRSSASTFCNRETVVVRDGPCAAAGKRLYSEDHVASARTYRGDAVRPGLDGVAVEGGYTAAVREDAAVVYDSGPHAYGSGSFVDDRSCG